MIKLTEKECQSAIWNSRTFFARGAHGEFVETACWDCRQSGGDPPRRTSEVAHDFRGSASSPLTARYAAVAWVLAVDPMSPSRRPAGRVNLRVCPETRPLSCCTGGEGEAPAEPQAERAGPDDSTGSRGSAPAGEQIATIVAESSRRGSAGASPSRNNMPSVSGETLSPDGGCRTCFCRCFRDLVEFRREGARYCY